ncbi:hypothetical protein HPB47_018597 [Ixodes persulcatus]|uniref:Uncharacterized protein n=1 Tax=Ixodes persulcatus TaxID=34615 RepID=A0AC60QKC5_IXOPE|nr:hypothetical protein HPB47_018597 [Ixodes persulcatus]
MATEATAAPKEQRLLPTACAVCGTFGWTWSSCFENVRSTPSPGLQPSANFIEASDPPHFPCGPVRDPPPPLLPTSAAALELWQSLLDFLQDPAAPPVSTRLQDLKRKT